LINRIALGLLKKTDRLIVLSPSMKQKLLQKSLSSNQVEIISNWANGMKIFPVEKEKNDLLEKWAIKNKFVVLYSGNMGRCHHFDTLLPVMQELSAVPDILFLFIGDGYGSQILKEFKNEHHLQNLSFLPYQKSEDLSLTMSVGDVHLVTLKEEMQDLMVPSKVYSALAAARPVIYIGPRGGEISRILEETECGVCVSIGDNRFLRESILKFYKDPALVRSFGEKARIYFERYADQKHLTSKFYDSLKKVLSLETP
jgi:glycosyltransferase involved in cell wall biosynthesis